MAIKWYKYCEYVVACASCDSRESIYSIDGEYDTVKGPSAYFRKQGWSDRNGKTLCPCCNRKMNDGIEDNETKALLNEMQEGQY